MKPISERTSPLAELSLRGQSIWLDYIRRGLIADGGLERLIAEDGVTGVTSNPSIFEKAIDESADYDDGLRDALARRPSAEPAWLYDALSSEDVRQAADALRRRYDETHGADGFVSLEPPPQLTRDTAGILNEARRIWKQIGRPNLMIKVVATREGIPAVEQLISEGINVNITLMFSLRHYEAVAQAYLRGLERCAKPDKVASVASFFISRIDTAVDHALEAQGSAEALDLRGKIAIANAKLAYRRFQEIFEGKPFEQFRSRRARPQRVLWASTSAKNPKYRDVMYVEELVAPDTVNTLPLETLEAFRSHGRLRGNTALEGVAEAEDQMRRLLSLGIDLDAVAEKLQADGVAAFAAAYDKVLAALDRKRQTLGAAPLNR